jgi:hypothetical protein
MKLAAPAAALAALTLCGQLGAQCYVNRTGGSRVNSNRPSDSDTPAASFSPLTRFNRSLPRFICFTGGYRSRFEGFTGGNFGNSSDSYMITRFRLGVDIKPAAWLNLYAELQDARVAWAPSFGGPPYQSTWDLRRAHLDFRDVERSSVALRIGRQDLNFGDGRVLGTAYWRNTSRGWDAAVLALNYRWFHASVFAASPVVPGVNGLSHHVQGNNFHGIYTTLRNVIPASDLEPYVFWRLSPNIRPESGAPARLDEKAAGLRWAGVRSSFDYDTEIVGETGHIGTSPIRAWALAARAGYAFPTHALRPRVFAEYNFASGDPDPADGRRNTFDQLYPNVHGHHGMADQVGWQNLHEIRGGLRLSLRRNWMVAGAYNDWWLANARDAFYNSTGGVVARDPKGLSGTHIGREFDIETTFRLNRDLEFGTGIGHVIPGEFLKNTNHRRGYTYPYVMVTYNVF